MRLGTIVRIAAILLGIASAVLLAHSAFGIRFHEDFLLFLDLVRETVGVVVRPFELLIVTPIANWLRAQGLVFHLFDHWKNAFVLLWLLFAAVAKALTAVTKSPGTTAFNWTWGGVCALTAGVLAGTAPLSHPAVFWWPASGYFIYWAGLNAWDAKFGFALLPLPLATFCGVAAVMAWTEPLAADPAVFWWPFAAFYVLLALHGGLDDLAVNALAAGVFILLAARAVPGVNLVFDASPSPGLATLAAVVGIEGIVNLLSAVSPRDVWQREFSDINTNVGLDILAVLGGAATIVYLAHLMA